MLAMDDRRDPVMAQPEQWPTKSALTRRRFLTLSASLLAVSACGAPDAETSSGSVLQYGEGGEFTTFNPWSQTANEDSVASQVFSRLVYKAMDGQTVGDLAESWELSEDGMSIKLTLRPGVTWHDGRKLVADDFVAMYGYLSDPDLQSDAGVQKIKELFAPVAAVKAPDPGTVVMEFSAPVPYALDLLDYWYALRFDDPSDTAFLKHRPVGTGPFKMTEFKAGQSATFQAFDGYFVKDQPGLDGFRYTIFAEGANLVNSLRSGGLDGVLIGNLANADALEGDSAYYLDRAPGGVWPLEVNTSKPPFDQVEVRQALSYSMNREQFAKVADFGLEKPVTSPFYAEPATGYVPDLVNAQSFDLDQAKSLLDGAGVADLTITYPVPDSYPNLRVYGEIWQADLAKIGVNLEIQNVSTARWGEIGSGEDKDTDVVPWLVARCLRDSAVFYAANSGYRPGKDHRFGYQNPTLEALIGKGATETDPDKRTQIYQQLNTMVVDECYNISMVTASQTWGWSSNVSDPKVDLAGNLDLSETTLST